MRELTALLGYKPIDYNLEKARKTLLAQLCSLKTSVEFVEDK
jgi:hypothetical protein